MTKVILKLVKTKMMMEYCLLLTTRKAGPLRRVQAQADPCWATLSLSTDQWRRVVCRVHGFATSGKPSSHPCSGLRTANRSLNGGRPRTRHTHSPNLPILPPSNSPILPSTHSPNTRILPLTPHPPTQDKLVALDQALVGARSPAYSAAYKGNKSAHQSSRRWYAVLIYSTFRQVVRCTANSSRAGLRGLARTLLEIHKRGGNAARAVERFVSPSGAEPVPRRSEQLETQMTFIKDQLVQHRAEQCIAKGVRPAAHGSSAADRHGFGLGRTRAKVRGSGGMKGHARGSGVAHE